MSSQSEAVKRWRKVSKKRIIDAMGGKCCVCGYNRCQEALALHHLDPSKKDISLGGVRANPKCWNSIVVELRKCVLICHVCHTEVHCNISRVPDNAPKFNEEFADYKQVQRQIKESEKLLNQTPCLLCGMLKPEFQKYCSYQCSSKAHYRVDWNNIDLHILITQKSVVQIAQELGCSDVAVHKRLKKLGLKPSSRVS